MSLPGGAIGEDDTQSSTRPPATRWKICRKIHFM